MKRHDIVAVAILLVTTSLSAPSMAQNSSFGAQDGWRDLSKVQPAPTPAPTTTPVITPTMPPSADSQKGKAVVLKDLIPDIGLFNKSPEQPSPTIGQVVDDVDLKDKTPKKKTTSEFKSRKTYDYRKAQPPKFFQQPGFDEANKHLPYVKYQMDYTKLLFSAVNKNNIGAVQGLLDKGADINGALTDSGMTPLMLAIFQRHNEITRYMILRGANLDVIDWDGRTALHIAAQNTDVRIMEMLMAYGAKQDVKDKSGHLPADYLPEGVRAHIMTSYGVGSQQLNDTFINFVKAGSVSDATVTLGKGADVNAKDSNGETPLFIATKANDTNMASMLLSRGANPLAKDSNGRIPINYVTASSSPSLAQLLETYTTKYELDNGVSRPGATTSTITPNKHAIPVVAPVEAQHTHTDILVHQEKNPEQTYTEDRTEDVTIYGDDSANDYKETKSDGFFSRLGRSFSKTFSGGEEAATPASPATVEAPQPIAERSLQPLDNRAASSAPEARPVGAPRSIVPDGMR